MRFVWFWTFWHWSREGFRDGVLLRSPLQGAASHWDEWYRYEASEHDRQLIREAGSTRTTQHRFVSWIVRHWSREAGFAGDRMVPRFLLEQLASLPPFDDWAALAPYRVGQEKGAVSAVVLAGESRGEADDVRPVECIALPAETDLQAGNILAENFRCDAADLDGPRRAALSTFSGKSLFLLTVLWITGGKRPYAPWLKVALTAGWLSVAGLILYLYFGPEPGERLPILCEVLMTLWLSLVSFAVVSVAVLSCGAWWQGKIWASDLKRSQIRVRMAGGLTMKGGSAGLPFCLAILLSIYRAYPQRSRRSWLWRQFFHKFKSDARKFAATGVITPDGYLKPVVIEEKLRACLRADGIRAIFTPRQGGVGRSAIRRIASASGRIDRPRQEKADVLPDANLGFAAEPHCLKAHSGRHVAQVILRLGALSSSWQKWFNAFVVIVSGFVLVALPDIRGILFPPPAPAVIKPSSPAPEYLWVSLDTRDVDAFQIAFESNYWSNRRADVSLHSGANASARAEIHLRSLSASPTRDTQDGVVWIERKRRFLTREYAPGERVGRYTLAYLVGLPHE